MGMWQKIVNGQSIPITFHGLNPGMEASPWLPNGTGIEYSYTRATALFNITNVNPRTDVEWYIYNVPMPGPLAVWAGNPVAIIYGLFATIKSGGGPVLNVSCLKALGNGFYDYTCPSSPRARMDFVLAYYAVAYSDVYIHRLVFVGPSSPKYADVAAIVPKLIEDIGSSDYALGRNNTVIEWGAMLYNYTEIYLGTRIFCVDFGHIDSMRFAGNNVPVKCVPMADPPRNIPSARGSSAWTSSHFRFDDLPVTTPPSSASPWRIRRGT